MGLMERILGGSEIKRSRLSRQFDHSPIHPSASDQPLPRPTQPQQAAGTRIQKTKSPEQTTRRSDNPQVHLESTRPPECPPTIKPLQEGYDTAQIVPSYKPQHVYAEADVPYPTQEEDRFPPFPDEYQPPGGQIFTAEERDVVSERSRYIQGYLQPLLIKQVAIRSLLVNQTPNTEDLRMQLEVVEKLIDVLLQIELGTLTNDSIKMDRRPPEHAGRMMQEESNAREDY